jgi:enoyl-CoA hydratase/carnithine racemase
MLDAMDSPFVSVAHRGAVSYLTLSNPARKNAVPRQGWEELQVALAGFASSDSRVLVIRGAGDDFCSGADLGDDEFDEMRSPATNRGFMLGPGHAAETLHHLSKPTIAAVDGVAVGAGMNLAIGCDIVIATERARFSEVFVSRGLSLDFGGTWLLPRLVGMTRARELALTGRVVEAAEALTMGLVTAVVSPAQLAAATDAMADRLAAGAPLAQHVIKVGLSRSLDMTFEQAVAYETQAQAVLLGSDDLREGVAAFLEKREPSFRGL